MAEIVLWENMGVESPESLWFGNYGKLVRRSVRRLRPPQSGASIPSRIPEW